MMHCRRGGYEEEGYECNWLRKVKFGNKIECYQF